MERIELAISRSRILGTGDDVDGEFVFDGSYDPGSHKVLLTRRYRMSFRSGADDPGLYAFDYEGVWDGSMVHGTWWERFNETNTGPFEMWPAHEATTITNLEIEELTARA